MHTPRSSRSKNLYHIPTYFTSSLHPLDIYHGKYIHKARDDLDCCLILLFDIFYSDKVGRASREVNRQQLYSQDMIECPYMYQQDKDKLTFVDAFILVIEEAEDYLVDLKEW